MKYYLEKLIEPRASAVNVVSYNPCVGPFPIIKIYFSLLSICTDELKLTQKIMTSYLHYHQAIKILNTNQIQYHDHKFISGSAFLVNLTSPSKQSLKGKESQNLNFVTMYLIHKQ